MLDILSITEDALEDAANERDDVVHCLWPEKEYTDRDRGDHCLHCHTRLTLCDEGETFELDGGFDDE